MASVTLSFSVDSEECKDIIGYYGKLPKGEKSREFVRVQRMHLENAGITLADLSVKLDRILDLLAAGVALGTGQEPNKGSSGTDVSKIDGLGL